MSPLSVGVLGCGTISGVYLDADDRFPNYEIVACADLDPQRSREAADEHGVAALAPDELLAADDIDVVVNLTPPSVHTETALDVLGAGKHLYVEKPLATTDRDADELLDAAERADLRVGAAPDTFLGAGLQTCRSLLDAGRIGEPVGATAIWVSGGHESWHPDPDIFYDEGGGPMLDMGPYYVTALVALLGPATRVTGSVSRTSPERTITSEPRRGETIDVAVPTHETAVVDFACGATATLLTTYDAPGGSSRPGLSFDLYGTEGTLGLSNPNNFDGPVHVREPGDDTASTVPLTHEYTAGRGVGIADLAAAIDGEWTHRSSGELARHVLEILSGVREASETGTHVELETTVERPAPVPEAFPANLGT